MTSAEGDDRPPIRVVLADANVLYPRVLRDHLLYAATQFVLEIRWSAAILAEVVAHLTENTAGSDAAADARLVTTMNGACPAAEVERDAGAVEAVAELRLPDEDDRHVLAAAGAVEADVLSTDNLKDFPTDTMNEAGIELISADALLSLLVTEFPDEILATHRLTVSRLPSVRPTNHHLTTFGGQARAGTADLVGRLLALGLRIYP